ncbi:hypothetical protein Lal_00046109, partial [Lupinus albus]
MTRTCKLGFVMYNTNSDSINLCTHFLCVGFDIQSIDWTTDMNSFLKTISCLHFNGNAFNQYAMAEGLAEALVMYTRPFNATSTAQDYYNGERHCVLVTIGNPIPLKMSVSVPMVQEGKLVLGKQLETNVDFLKVAQIFKELATSFSVISPSQHAIFGQLFNLGNNIAEMENAPFSNYKVDELLVMISKNFKEAHEAIYEKGLVHDSMKRSLESMRTRDITFTKLLTSVLPESEDLFSIREETIKSAKAVRPKEVRSVTSFMESQVIEVNQNSITNASSSTTNACEDTKGELEVNNNDIGQPSKKPKTCINLDPLTGLILPPQLSFDGVIDPFGEEQTNFTLKMDSYMDALKAVEAELDKPMEGGGGGGNNDNGVQISPLVFPKAPSTTSRELMEFPKSGLLLNEPRINAGVMNYFTIGNNSTSALLPHQNSSTLWHTSPQQARNVYGNSFYPNVSGNSLFGGGSSNNSHFGGGSSNNSLFGRSMSNSLSGGGSSSNSHFGGGSTTNSLFGGGSSTNSNTHFVVGSKELFPSDFGTRNINLLPSVPRNIADVTGPQSLFMPLPSTRDFDDYVQMAWEGQIGGSIKLGGKMYHDKGQGFRRPTSSFKLTFQWPITLEIIHYIPLKAVRHTQSLIQNNVDYVYFHITQHNNLRLYDHLIKNDMCARINVPSQTLILTPTEKELYYVGTVFQGVRNSICGAMRCEEELFVVDGNKMFHTVKATLVNLQS